MELLNKNVLPYNLARQEIEKVLAHRGPETILVDEVEIHYQSAMGIGRKFLTGKEIFFNGHFNNFPLMPSATMMEGLFQVAEILIHSVVPGNILAGRIPVLTKIHEANFWKKIKPGTLVEYETTLIKINSQYADMEGRVYYKEGKLAASMKFSGKLVAIPLQQI